MSTCVCPTHVQTWVRGRNFDVTKHCYLSKGKVDKALQESQISIILYSNIMAVVNGYLNACCFLLL